MITIAKMVQAAKATQIQQHLTQLVPALLDSLSGMEVCHPLHHFCYIIGCPVAEGADATFNGASTGAGRQLPCGCIG